MFPEFGQAPLCLELDLDSYEGPWQHVAAFRGRSGWLTAARATVQSAHDLLRQVLITACDDQENPIPSWRAVHLTECRWHALEHCHEQPPDLLDDLLCEEEGALYARWQREMNAELAGLAADAAARISALEARMASSTRQAERQIAELNRRRRLTETSSEARATLMTVIADIEAENDAAVSSLASERARLRREAEAAEEALWQRDDILFEIEPLWCVNWTAPQRRADAERRSPSVRGATPSAWRRVRLATIQRRILVLEWQSHMENSALSLSQELSALKDERERLSADERRC